MAAIGVVQGRAQTSARVFVNQRCKTFGAQLAPEENPGVQRAARAWRNDLENMPIF
jgi:glutathione S-transferase